MLSAKIRRRAHRARSAGEGQLALPHWPRHTHRLPLGSDVSRQSCSSGRRGESVSRSCRAPKYSVERVSPFRHRGSAFISDKRFLPGSAGPGPCPGPIRSSRYDNVPSANRGRGLAPAVLLPALREFRLCGQFYRRSRAVDRIPCIHLQGSAVAEMKEANAGSRFRLRCAKP